jgi:hypothetical protein
MGEPNTPSKPGRKFPTTPSTDPAFSEQFLAWEHLFDEVGNQRDAEPLRSA